MSNNDTNYIKVRNSPLAAELSDEQCVVLAGLVTNRGLQDAEILIKEGDVSNELFGISKPALARLRHSGGQVVTGGVGVAVGAGAGVGVVAA